MNLNSDIAIQNQIKNTLIEGLEFQLRDKLSHADKPPISFNNKLDIYRMVKWEIWIQSPINERQIKVLIAAFWNSFLILLPVVNGKTIKITAPKVRKRLLPGGTINYGVSIWVGVNYEKDIHSLIEQAKNLFYNLNK